MKNINLKASLRDLKKEKVQEARLSGKVPAVLYGQGAENKNIWVNALEFDRVFDEAGENIIVELAVGDESKENVLIYEFQTDSLSGKITHIDFLRVNMKESIETEVPLILSGEAPAVKEKGGILVKVMDDVTVKCLPGNIPHEFTIDLTVLVNFEDKITVSDLKVPENVEILNSTDSVIVSVSEPRSEADLADLDEKVEEDVSKVEGVKEKEVENAEEEKKEDKK